MTIHDSRMCPSSVHTMRRIASRARALTNDTVRATRSRDDEGTRGANGTARDRRRRRRRRRPRRANASSHSGRIYSREVVNGDDGPTGAESVA